MQAFVWQPRRTLSGAPVNDERHRRESTRHYRLVQQHASALFAQAESETGADLPQLVEEAFDAFLECGILAHGLPAANSPL